jgi:signal transduction histidine kinase
VRVEFTDALADTPPLSDTYATHLYRIAQEALTNVMRHSLASEVTIGLESLGDELQLRIDDNGRGFAHPPPDGLAGLGLKMMRYRAQMLGGDLVLESSAQGGVSVRCSCPLDP